MVGSCWEFCVQPNPGSGRGSEDGLEPNDGTCMQTG